ncbi:MAG: hypothetical protein ACKOTZ_12645 [Chloroflexota bacterium]
MDGDDATRSDAGRPRPAPPGPALPIVGALYLGLGAILGVLWAAGLLPGALFPTGWLLPAVLVASGALMVARRRFDLVALLWGVLALVVFQLDLALYLDAAVVGVDDPAAFDAALIAGALGLVPVILRGGFRR